MEKYAIGDIVEGTITHIEKYGAFMIFPNDTNGLLHISEITEGFVYDISKYFHIGNVYRVKVIGIDDTNGFLKVSIKKITLEERKALNEASHKRAPIEESDIDFTPLKENLPGWIESKVVKEK